MLHETGSPTSYDQPMEQPTEAGEPSLTDGIGISLEQAKALIAKYNNMVVANDEPTLIELTILNAFLAEVEKLHTRHKEGLSKLMADKTDAYVSGVQTAVVQLTESLSSASLEGIRNVLEVQATGLRAFKNSMSWLAAIVAASALLNVAVFVLGGLN